MHYTALRTETNKFAGAHTQTQAHTHTHMRTVQIEMETKPHLKTFECNHFRKYMYKIIYASIDSIKCNKNERCKLQYMGEPWKNYIKYRIARKICVYRQYKRDPGTGTGTHVYKIIMGNVCGYTSYTYRICIVHPYVSHRKFNLLKITDIEFKTYIWFRQNLRSE